VLIDMSGPAGAEKLRSHIERYLAGEISGEIALMHIALQLGEAGSLVSTLETLLSALPESRRATELLRLARANAGTLPQITSLLKNGLGVLPPPGAVGVAVTRAQFDKAVQAAPEASVALYSLGSPAILDRATEEIVTRLAEWELLGPDCVVLDIGCGIGRIERALAGHVGAITGIDLSPAMIAEARQRCRGLANVIVQTCEGRDLAAFADQSVDLVLAIDAFPYLVAIDPAVAEAHVRDAARLLRPGGALLILNFSYRGDIEADRHDMARLAAASGFAMQRAGTWDFTLWDGATYLLMK
jgi:SAM-dependent methyltransferase